MAWKQIQKHYAEMGSPHRLNNFGLKFFCNPEKPHKEYPTLHHLKAAETRALVHVLSPFRLELRNMDHGALKGRGEGGEMEEEDDEDEEEEEEEARVIKDE